MKTSIATVSISGDLPEKLAAIAAAGFNGIEIFEQDFIAYDGGPKEVGQMVRDHGLSIDLFQPFRDFEGMPEPDRARAFDRAERKFDLMQQMGAELILVCSNVSAKSLGGVQRAADDLHELGERAAKRGVRVGYEALAWGRHVNDHRDAWEIVRRADHANIGLILDSFHTLARKTDPATIRSIPGDKVFFVQLADAPLIDMDLLYWSRHFRNMPGEGDLDVVSFMRAVAATGYQGPLSLEIFNDQFRGGSPRTIARDGHRSLVYLMDQVRRQEPDIAIQTAEMPARVKSEGFAFVEFAASDEGAKLMADMLRSLGFRRTGRHITKAVDLWRQGDIRIVINTDSDGFAHTSYVAHGLTVCDLGMRVANAADTVTRARALGATPFSQPVGPGELTIPAIRGVGGGLLHFIDDASGLSRVWDIEFQPVNDAAAAADAGLLAVDHVAQVMNYEEMLTWALFYVSIFDVAKSPTVDVVDPGGLVRSQVIASPDAALRITMNGAENHRTMAGQFVADSFGSSVQHVALSSADIFATAAALAQNGFKPLEMPANYYDDLVARFDLPPEQVVRLTANNILYDRDEAGGEFFQIYSRPYGDGMFFEITERRGGYNGYGAANAPFRTAAMKRLLRAKGMPRK